MMKVEFNNKTSNPFTGMGNVLTLFQSSAKGSVSDGQLNVAWKECKTHEQKAMFMSLLFSVGDVPRQHNIFDGKVDNGGHAKREVFRDVILPWMWKNVIKKQSQEKRTEFLYLVFQYTVLDNVLGARVKTKKKTSSIEQIINMISVFSIEEVTNLCARLFRGTDADRMSLAKFLIPPRKRPGQQKETQAVQHTKGELLKAFSDMVNLPWVDDKGYLNFFGYKAWRRPYIANSESTLFSSGLILSLDQEQFYKFLEQCPSDARFRVKRRIYKNEKYAKLKTYYDGWEAYKEAAQAQQRSLEEKIKQGLATESDVKLLTKVKKAAKVNKGASNIGSIIMDVLCGNTIDGIKVQSVMDAISLFYNTLVIIDDSGSMSWGGPVTPRSFACGIATVCMMKNPSSEARNLLGLFSNDCRFYSSIESVEVKPNNLMRGTSKVVKGRPLIDPTKGFVDNFKNVKGFVDKLAKGSSTNIRSIADTVLAWTESDPTAIDQLGNYPVWTLISDGEFNNEENISASLGAMFKVLESKLGFKPYVLLIDVNSRNNQIRQFTGLDNVMMVPPTPEAIEMMLTNFRDMDVYDVYTPLLSLYRSNRYAPVRKLFVNEKTVENLVETV